MPALAALLVGVIAAIGIFASGWLPWGFWEGPPAAVPRAQTATVMEATEDMPATAGNPFTDRTAADAVAHSPGRVLGEAVSLAVVPTAYPVAVTAPVVAANMGVSPSFLAQFSQFLQSFSAYLAAPAASGVAYPRYGGYLPQTGGTTALSSPAITGGTISGASSGSFDALSAGTLALTGALTGTDATFSGTLTAGTLSVAGVSSGGAITGPYFTATSTTATSTFAGVVGVGTTSPRADLHIAGSGKIMVQNGNTLQDRSGDFWMTSNAYYDGANWQRQNVSKAAFGLDLRGNSNLPNEVEQGAALWVAQPGANPVTSTFGTTGGWELGWAITAARNLVVGGMGIELDGNGLTPYGRVVHNNGLSTVNTGIVKNLYADFSGRDASAQPSWFAGFVDDAFNVRRLAGSAAISNGNFSSLLSLDSSGNMTVTGNVGIGNTSPSEKLNVQGTAAFQLFNATSTTGTSTIATGQGFTIGGSQFVLQQGSGRVGIGTSSPQALLSVAGAGSSLVNIGDYFGSGYGAISLNGTADSTNYNFLSGNSVTDNSLYLNRASGGAMHFREANGTDQLTILTGGNVGIGTTTPWGKLSVQASDNSSAPQLVVGSSTATSLFVGANGYVGIGTLTPLAKLHVQDSNNGITSIGVANFDSGNAARASIGAANDAGATLSLQALSSNFTSAGIFQPNYGLLVADAVLAGFNIGTVGAGDPVNFYSAAVNRMTIDSAGNVGIGTTTPWGKLSITGSGTGTGLAFAVADSANTPRFVIQDNGNVGIGTTSPTYALSVAGNTSINNTLYVTNTAATDFRLRTRLNVSTFPVPNFSPVATNTVVAFDVMPNGTPIEQANNGFAWMDICDGDFNYNANVSSSCARAGVRSDYIEFSSRQFNGAAIKPIVFNLGQAGSSLFEAMRITSSGNVGIGNTSPSEKLNVQGTAAFQLFNATSTTGTSTIATGQGFTIGGSQFVVQQGSGNVGIGTTSPTLGLSYNSASRIVGIVGDGSASASAAGVLALGNNRATPTTGDSVGTIDFISVGNGTASGQIGSRIRGLLNGSGGANGIGQDLVFYTKADNGAGIGERLRITAGGNVGIGTTTPWGKLSISGSGTGTGLAFAVADSANTPRFVIQDDGNVGIGTSSPATLLSVAGSGYLTGGLGVGVLNTTAGTVALSAPSTNSASNFTALSITGAQSVANTGTYYGMNINPTYTAVSGNTLTGQFGLQSNPKNASSGTVTTQLGVLGAPQNTSSGVVSNMYGVVGQPQNTDAGTITAMYGLAALPANTSTGTTTTMYGIFSQPRNSSTGSVGTMYGAFIDGGNSNASGQPISNLYQVYLANPITTGPITSTYGVYQQYTSAINYFGGNVGIGTSSPTAQLHTTGTVRFSNFGAGTLTTDASGNVSVSSDERLKNIDGDFTRGLADIQNITPINYHWNEVSGLDREMQYTGFSAQNVREAIPEAVGENPNGFLSLNDRPILAAVVNAIKELWNTMQDRFASQDARIAKLEARITELEARPVANPDGSYTITISSQTAAPAPAQESVSGSVPPPPDETTATSATSTSTATSTPAQENNTASSQTQTTEEPPADFDMQTNTPEGNPFNEQSTSAPADNASSTPQ